VSLSFILAFLSAEGYFCSTPQVLVNQAGEIVGVLGGQPKNNGGWNNAVKCVFAEMKKLSTGIKFTLNETDHGRGDFPTFAFGISRGSSEVGFLIHGSII
jgi:hypothetical protein